ncbi:hypothetical protein Pcinc_009219 [Petrolisthes cinctipes]|uniref:Uncharacterized protein n=1 Tax=Petrolisthes cinctipes TaxID=88211 RepID=A0AAE1G7D8_PETCI|nr:hypothetical protein Pcinc_009219 [Petrolisthes cinctipes]
MVVSPSSLPAGHLGQLPQPLYHLQDTPTETRSFSQLSHVAQEQSHATAQLQAGALPSSGQIQAGSLGSIHGAGIQLQPAPSGFRSQELSRNHILYLETSMSEGMTSAAASRSPGSMGRAANVRTVAAGMGPSSSDGGSLASLRKRSYEARSPESPLQGLIRCMYLTHPPSLSPPPNHHTYHTLTIPHPHTHTTPSPYHIHTYTTQHIHPPS